MGADDCLDWEQFAKDLDIALAHIIEAAKTDTPPEDYQPSKISALKVMEFAHLVAHRNKEARAAEEARLTAAANDEDGEALKAIVASEAAAEEDGRRWTVPERKKRYVKKADRPDYKPCKWCGRKLNSTTSDYHPMCLVEKLRMEESRGK